MQVSHGSIVINGFVIGHHDQDECHHNVAFWVENSDCRRGKWLFLARVLVYFTLLLVFLAFNIVNMEAEVGRVLTFIFLGFSKI
jgi:hypothetical protein